MRRSSLKPILKYSKRTLSESSRHGKHKKTTNGALRKAVNHFEEALLEIHMELEDLNAEAVKLAAIIKRNFEELGDIRTNLGTFMISTVKEKRRFLCPLSFSATERFNSMEFGQFISLRRRTSLHSQP